MKKSLLFSVLLTILFLLPSTSFSQTSTQVIGKLYTKTEANQLYGAVNKSIEISTSTLDSLLQIAPDNIMFNLINDQLVILDGKRNQIFGPAQSISANQIFYVFSTSQVQALLELGNSSVTTVELRDSVLTVTNGDETLELGDICPPVCP